MARPLGTDFSHWNGTVNWTTAKNAGVAFSFVKASQLVRDSQFTANWQNSKLAGVPRGAYHYLDWSKPIQDQVNLFVATMAGDYGNLPPVVDFEQNPATYGLTPAMVQSRLWSFLTLLEAKVARIPILYTGYYFWKQWGSIEQKWARYPFWLAWYNVESVIRVPAPWTKWTFWQFTDAGNGPTYGTQSAQVDLNYFNGTQEELNQFIAGNTVPVTPTTDYTYIANANANIRKGPLDSDPIIGVLYKGTTATGKGVISGTRTQILTPMAGWVTSIYLTPTTAPGYKTCPTCNGTGKVPV